jgi:hypothetical protein
MFSFIFGVALLNIGLGFAVGVYLGRRHRTLLVAGPAASAEPQDALAAALANVQANLGQESLDIAAPANLPLDVQTGSAAPSS